MLNQLQALRAMIAETVEQQLQPAKKPRSRPGLCGTGGQQ